MSALKFALICSATVILGSIILAQGAQNSSSVKGKELPLTKKCTRRTANSTCGVLCDEFKCVQNGCVCSTPLRENVVKLPPNAQCKQLARKRRWQDRANQCYYESTEIRQFLCCLHPRPEKPENPEPEEPETGEPEAVVPPLIPDDTEDFKKP